MEMVFDIKKSRFFFIIFFPPKIHFYELKKSALVYTKTKLLDFTFLKQNKKFENFWVTFEKNVAQYIQSKYPVNCHETLKN
jgi:hypothetical protein